MADLVHFFKCLPVYSHVNADTYDYFRFFSLVNISDCHSIYFQFTMVYFSYNTVPEEPLWEGPK